MELDACHQTGAYNFQVASKFLENLCTPGIEPNWDEYAM